MTSIIKRKFMYEQEVVDGDKELDYLATPFSDMDLPTVKVIRISAPFRYRPDLVSLKELGNFHMGWLLSIHNNLMDPIYDYEIGREIEIPDMDEYYRYYNRTSRRNKA